MRIFLPSLALVIAVSGESPAQVNVTLRIVDQSNAELAGSRIEIPALSPQSYPTGSVVALPEGYLAFGLRPGVAGILSGLYRLQSAVVTASTAELRFEWITVPLHLHVRDQFGADIPGSALQFWTIGGQTPGLPTGTIVRVPITDESVYTDLTGPDQDGYRLNFWPAVPWHQALPPLTVHLIRTRSGLEVSSATTEIAFEWITSPVRLRVHDQSGTDIPGAAIQLWSIGQTFGLPTGSILAFPVTDESIYPEMSGLDRDGYRFNIWPAVSWHPGQAPLPLHLIRTLEENEVGAGTTEIAFAWITSQVQIRVRDQFGADIMGSELQLLSVAGQTLTMPTGSLITLPVTDESVYPELTGLDRDGYRINLWPGMNGTAQYALGTGRSYLSRVDGNNEVGAGTSALVFEWLQHTCFLRVVDAQSQSVAGSSIGLPAPFPSGYVPGTLLTLPITDNATYSMVAGLYANGYPIVVGPGDVAPATGTFEFEVLAGGGLRPGSFVIAGNSYSLACEQNRPPVADAGPNRTIASSAQPQTTIVGIANDADMDLITYRWLRGSSILLGSTPVASTGAAPLDLGTVPPLGVGIHTLTLEVSDGLSTATSDMVLTVDNSGPAAACSGSGTHQLGVDPVALVATVGDFDGDVLAFEWREGGTVYASGTVSTTPGGSPTQLPTVLLPTGLQAGSQLGPGNHSISLSVSDGSNPTVTCTIQANVADTNPPRLSPSATPAILWPPNHQMVPVTIETGAMDGSGGPVTLSATVTSSEDPLKDGSGQTIPDFTNPVIEQEHGRITLQLRAERTGKGKGRAYTIVVRAVDLANNESSASVVVFAPRDQGGQ